MRYVLSAALCCALVVTSSGLTQAQYPGAEPPPKAWESGFDAITPTQSQAWLSVLAGPEFSGRGTGQEGYTLAAHWVAGKLAEWGYEPIGDGGTFFQNLPMTRLSVVESESELKGPRDFRLVGGEGIAFTRFTSEPRTSGKLVVVNASGPETEWDSEVPLDGRIVLLVSDESLSNRFLFRLARLRPAAIFNVRASVPPSRPTVLSPGRGGRVAYLEGVLSNSAAKALVQAAGGESDWLTPSPKPGLDVHPLEAEATLTLRVREEPAALPNVVGWLEGSDPDLRHEYVTVGAHLDHLGNRNGTLYPGADDNGSGSTAILQVAHALATSPHKTKRSVLFIWFAAEELGLVGSRHYVEHPIKPLEDMVCMFNIDMIGRNEETRDEPAAENQDTIHLVGSQKGESGLHELILDANKYVNLKFEYDEESRVFTRSDQANFYRADIAVAFLFGGFNPHYHQPSDTLEGINFEKITAAAKLYYGAVMLASDHEPFRLKKEAAAAESGD